MTKRRASSPVRSSVISGLDANQVLDTLCQEYGFCLSPLWRARLVRNPPKSVEKFTETVFRAEGLDPALAARELRRNVSEVIERGFSRTARGKSNDA